MKITSKLVPQYPEKTLRLTLDPVQAVGLWHLLDMHIDSFEELESPTDLQKLVNLVYESIETMLSDRLDFKTTKGA